MTRERKIWKSLLVAVFLFPCAAALAAPTRPTPQRPEKLPSVDEVFQRSLTATGGRDAWLKLTSMHMKASVSMDPAGLSGTLDIYSKAPDKESDCLKLSNGLFFCRAFDGKTGWQDDSKDGLRSLEGKPLEDMRRDANFYSELDRKKQYTSLKVDRQDDFNSLRVYVLAAVRNDGTKLELYFDKETGLEAGLKEFGATPEETKTTYLEEYQMVAGPQIRIPTKMRMASNSMGMRIVMEEIFPNVEIADATFGKPAKSARDPQGSGEEGHPDNGKVTDGVYRNEFFGFVYTMPQGWTVHGEETEKALMEAGRDIMAGDNEEKRKMLERAGKRTYHLLTIFEFPLGTPGKTNRSVQVLAENVSFAPGIQTGKDYILNLEQVLASSQLHVHYEGEPVEESLDGIDFYRQDLTMEVANKTIFEKIYCTRMKGYAVSFILVAQNKDAVEEVAKSLASVRKISGDATKP